MCAYFFLGFFNKNDDDEREKEKERIENIIHTALIYKLIATSSSSSN